MNFTNSCIDAPLGYGEVLDTGRIDTALLISSYKDYLFSKSMFIQETFDFDALQFESEYISYKTIKAKRIQCHTSAFEAVKNVGWWVPLSDL